MNRVQSEALKAELLKSGNPLVAKLYEPGPLHRVARFMVEAHAKHLIADTAPAADVTIADGLGDSAELSALPPGWFQALLAALPQILAFVQAILKIFHLGG